MSIKKVLRLIIIVTLVVLLALTFMLFKMTSSFDNERLLKNQQLEYYQLGIRLQAASDYLTDQARRYVQYGDQVFYDNYWREVNETKTREQVIERLKEMNTEQKFLEMLENAANESNDLVNTEDEAMKAVAVNDFDTARRLMFDSNYDAAKAKILKYTDQFQEEINQQAAERANRAVSTDNQIKIIMFILIFSLIAVITVSFLYIGIKIKRLGDITARMNVLSSNEGDLTSRLEFNSSDEIGDISRSFNLFTQKVQDIVKDVFASTNNISDLSINLNKNTTISSGSSEEISRVIEEIAKGATDQARDTESGVSSIGDLGQMIDEELDIVDILYEKSKDVTNLISEGFDSINILNSKSEENLSISSQVGAIMTETNESTEKIASASQMIKSISDQTNLLALNAAIEAARAGESGRGFAVVADEIRKLAEDSNVFANEISDIINELIYKTKNAVTFMKETEAIAGSQREQTLSTREKFSGISESIISMQAMIDQLKGNAEITQDRKDHIISIMENLSAISEENAASTEEATASFQEQTASISEISMDSNTLADKTKEVLIVLKKFKF